MSQIEMPACREMFCQTFDHIMQYIDGLSIKSKTCLLVYLEYRTLLKLKRGYVLYLVAADFRRNPMS